MKKQNSTIEHLISHEKIELDKHIEDIVLRNQSSSGGGGSGGGTDLAVTDDRYLKLDQTTPQTVTGQPTFDGGIKVINGFIILNE